MDDSEKRLPRSLWGMCSEYRWNKAIDLFYEKNIIFVTGGGSPAPVWAIFRDGHVLVSADMRLLKRFDNMVRPSSEVVISVASRDDPLLVASFTGFVEEIIPDHEYRHADRMAQQYLGKARYPFRRDSEERVVLRVKPRNLLLLPDMFLNSKWEKKPPGP